MVRLAAFVAALTLLLRPAAAAQDPAAFALVHATVLDGTGAPPGKATVVVRAGRIESIVPPGSPVPPDATVVDLTGAWLLPGLIDAHVHFRDLASARRALQAGVTTARSLGSDHFADAKIRDLHRQGASDVPDVIAAGYHIRRRPSDALFLDAPSLHPLMPGPRGPEDVRRMVRALVERGADVIKLMATDRAGLADTDFRRRVLTDEELAAAVAEASRSGRKVAAHAHTDDGALAAVRAGVRTVEHGTLVGQATLAAMRERGTCLVPTLSFWMDMADPGGEYDAPGLAARAREMLPRAREVVRAAARANVAVAAGSDTRYDGVSDLAIADEVAALVASGLPAAAAIQAATSTAARCLGIDARTGTVEAGREADIIAVGGDPLVDPRALKDVVLVVSDGRIGLDGRRGRR